MSNFREGGALWLVALALFACRDPGPGPALGLSLTLLAPSGAIAAVESYSIVLKGAGTTDIRTGASGETVRFGALKEGSYTIAVLGLTGGQVESFFADTVFVAPRKNVAVLPALTSFQPTLTPLPSLSIQARTTVRWSTVTGAEGYVLERSGDSLFRNVRSTSLTTNQAVDNLVPGQYYFRVRALNEFVPVPGGRPSAASGIEIAVPSLAFTTPPSLTALGQAIPSVGVTILAGLRTVSSANDSVVLTIAANPGNGALTGTTIARAVNGVARFDSLVLDRWGAGYTLRASLGGATSVVSVPFDVRRAFLRASTGNGTSCGLLTTGAAYCWGSNSAGQLGDNSVVDKLEPSAVGSTLRFSSISTGGGHVCALANAQPFCWGLNDSAQVGDSSTVNRRVPVPVRGSLQADVIAAGGRHSCAVRVGVPRLIFCWGANNVGQLGNLSRIGSAVPVQVNSRLDWRDVSAGLEHTCATSVPAGAYCWGGNNFGQLGDSTGISRFSPTPVAGGGAFTGVTAGDAHSCALSGARVFCWGANTFGQLGDRSLTLRTTPVQAIGAPPISLVTAGGQHTCALSTSREAWCWGANGQGQLGDGTFVDRPIPTRVLGGLFFADLWAGAQHTCGRTPTGGLYCWGHGRLGELGNGTLNSVTIPRAVTGSMP